LGLGLLTALLATQTHTLALSLTIMLLPAPVLLIYRDWKAPALYATVWAGVLLIQLVSGDAPGLLNLPVDAGHSKLHTVATLGSVLALCCSLLIGLSLVLQREQAQSAEAKVLLGRLSPQRLFELTERVSSPADGQRLSPSAEVFNAHADHLVRIVAAFQMLKGDMKDLSDIAARLRQKAAVQKERSEMGADQVGTLYENNDKLSTRAEAIAQTARGAFDSAERILEAARQYEDEIRTVRERVQSGRDNIDRLFHQLVQVKAAMTGVKNITDKITAIRLSQTDGNSAVDAAQLQSLGQEAERQHQHMEQTVEELTTAIYNTTQVMTLFQEKVEMSFNMTRQITKSTQSLQEENAGTAGAIEDMVIQMHHSQRQAMDLLSSLEYARNASQEAIAVIESSAHHIVRGEALVDEIDKHLMRFKI
jgi:hypothetical protein